MMPYLIPAARVGQVSSAPRQAAFGYIFVATVIDLLAIGVIAPTLPRLVAHLQGGDLARAAVTTGMFASMLAAMQLLFAPFFGALSDRIGRRPIAMLTSFGYCCDYVLMALAPSTVWLYPGRILSGITSSFPAGGAYIADVSPPEKRAAHIGIMWTAMGIGIGAGPIMGGYLGSINLRLPFAFAAMLSLANVAYSYFILPESLSKERRAPFDWRRVSPVGSWKLLRSTPVLFALTVAAALHVLARGALSDVFVLYSDYRFNWDQRTVGLVFSVIGGSSMFVSAVLIGPIVQRFGERNALLFGTLGGILGYAMLGLAPTGLLFILAIFPKSLVMLGVPTLQSLMTRQVAPSQQGQLVGAMTSAVSITGVVAPLMFTRVFAAAIDKNAIIAVPGAPFLLAAALLAVSLYCCLRATSYAAQPEDWNEPWRSTPAKLASHE